MQFLKLIGKPRYLLYILLILVMSNPVFALAYDKGTENSFQGTGPVIPSPGLAGIETFTPVKTPLPTPMFGFIVPIYVKPDFNFSTEAAFIVKAGFKVTFRELKTGKVFSAVTNSDGFAEVQLLIGQYDIAIAKPGFLMRSIMDQRIYPSCIVGIKEYPVPIWAGDILDNGIADNAINLSDIMQIAKSFNTMNGNSGYNPDCDLNKDNAVNMEDVLITAKHFNKTPGDYPPVIINPPNSK